MTKVFKCMVFSNTMYHDNITLIKSLCFFEATYMYIDSQIFFVKVYLFSRVCYIYKKKTTNMSR